MTTVVIPKPAYNVLRLLTGESRPDIALRLALKDLVRLRLEAVRAISAAFEEKYKMSFADFEKSWEIGDIQPKHS